MAFAPNSDCQYLILEYLSIKDIINLTKLNKYCHEWLHNLPVVQEIYICIEFHIIRDLLVCAATKGMMRLVKWLLVRKVGDRSIAFKWAAGQGSLPVVKLFVESGVEINRDVLLWASSNGHTEVIKFLMEHLGIQFNIVFFDNEIKYIFEQCPKERFVGFVNYYLSFPKYNELHLSYILVASVKNECLELVQLVFDMINKTTQYLLNDTFILCGNSIIEHVTDIKYQIMRFLLSRKNCIRDPDLRIIIRKAIANGVLDMIKLFVEYDCLKNYGVHLLIDCIVENQLTIIEYLKENNLIEVTHDTIFYCITNQKFKILLCLMKDRKWKQFELDLCLNMNIILNDLEMTEYLLKLGGIVDFSNDRDYSVDMLKLFIKYGFNISKLQPHSLRKFMM